MAGRGRGRGRGFGGVGGGFNFGPVKDEPFELFPPLHGDGKLPDHIIATKEDIYLIGRKTRLQKYWRSSPYYLEVANEKSNNEVVEIEQYSDKNKSKVQAKRSRLSDYMKLTPDNFPAELIHGSKRIQRDPRRLQWNADPDLYKLDVFEKLEQKFQGKEEKDGKPKKEGENEDEEEEVEEEEEEEEESDDGDYNQNIDFDDDEDDLNLDEGDEDEAVY